MAMSSEDLEKTGLFKTIMEHGESDDTGSLYSIDEIRERLEYMDIEEEKRDKYFELIDEIKKEKDEHTRQFLFRQLAKIINKEGSYDK